MSQLKQGEGDLLYSCLRVLFGPSVDSIYMFKNCKFQIYLEGKATTIGGLFLVLCCLNENKCIWLRMGGSPSARANGGLQKRD